MTKCAHCEAFKGSYCLRNNSIKIVKFIPYSVDSNLNEIECGDFIQLLF